MLVDRITKLKESGLYGRHVNTSSSQQWLHVKNHLGSFKKSLPGHIPCQLNQNREGKVGELNYLALCFNKPR